MNKHINPAAMIIRLISHHLSLLASTFL